MYILTSLCGYHVDIESHTNKGRMDMTVKTAVRNIDSWVVELS